MVDKRSYLNPDIIESLTQPAVIAWEIDPLNYFVPKDIPRERLIEASGYIPGFITNQSQTPCREQLTRNYGCGPLTDFSDNWSMDEQGVIISKHANERGHYEMFYPLLKLEFLLGSPQAETVRTYQHAYVSIRSKQRGFFLTRMD